MRFRNLVWLSLCLPMIAMADADRVDVFSKLLEKEAQIVDAEMEAKLQSNRMQSNQYGSSHLPGMDQQASNKEPTVEAIWGLAGKEVAEINYQGRRIPVSMLAPYISHIDGWKLLSIKPYEVILVRMEGKKIVQRKAIHFDWQSEASHRMESLPTPSSPIMIPQPAIH